MPPKWGLAPPPRKIPGSALQLKMRTVAPAPTQRSFSAFTLMLSVKLFPQLHDFNPYWWSVFNCQPDSRVTQAHLITRYLAQFVMLNSIPHVLSWILVSWNINQLLLTTGTLTTLVEPMICHCVSMSLHVSWIWRFVRILTFLRKLILW